MRPTDYRDLLRDIEQELLNGAQSVAVLGLTSITLRILSFLDRSDFARLVKVIYVPETGVEEARSPVTAVLPMSALCSARHDLVIVADDENKEDLLGEALPFIQGVPRVVIAGYGHFKFRDSAFRELLGQLLVPSLANGYPNTQTHLYQCLANAARLGLSGVVAEFGMFKGGTTMLLSRTIERLGKDWRVIGFDTFGGFPPRRSILDMYSHPDCVFTDLPAVRQALVGRNVEIVPGDIVETCHRLDKEDLVVTFVDTDNYTPAKAALEVAQERTVVGGAIVFDHFTGVNRFRYTLGERMAGSVLLADPRYFHLHDTGVFYRQR